MADGHVLAPNVSHRSLPIWQPGVRGAHHPTKFIREPVRPSASPCRKGPASGSDHLPVDQWRQKLHQPFVAGLDIVVEKDEDRLLRPRGGGVSGSRSSAQSFVPDELDSQLLVREALMQSLVVVDDNDDLAGGGVCAWTDRTARSSESQRASVWQAMITLTPTEAM